MAGVDGFLSGQGVKVTGVILAGGKSSRMGADKALLKIGPYSVIERVAAVLRAVTDELLIVTGQPEKYASFGDLTTPDLMPGNGPLGGIHAALTKSAHQLALITACDLPFISAPLCRLLIGVMAPGLDAATPLYRGRIEPLCAVYSKTALKVIERRLSLGLNKTTLLFDELKVRYVEEAELSKAEICLEKVFFNLNTPSDLATARAWSAAERQIHNPEEG